MRSDIITNMNLITTIKPNVIICAWCGTKREVDFPTGEESHGICPSCYEKEMKRMKEYHERKAKHSENIKDEPKLILAST